MRNQSWNPKNLYIQPSSPFIYNGANLFCCCYYAGTKLLLCDVQECWRANGCKVLGGEMEKRMKLEERESENCMTLKMQTVVTDFLQLFQQLRPKSGQSNNICKL